MKYLYRLSGGEVLSQSIEVDPWPGVDTRFYGVLTDPAVDSGLDPSAPKIWDGALIRNATAAEISAFPTAAQTDENLIAREEAADLFLTEKGPLAKMFRLFTLVTLDEVNVCRRLLGLTDLTITDIRAKARAYLDAGAAD